MGQEKNVRVTIIARPDDSEDGICFRLESDLGNGDRLTFKNDKKGDTYRVTYCLDDGDLGLKFRKRPYDAIWVAEGSYCPESPCTNDEFKPLHVTPDRRELVVLNKNGFADEFCYTLRFRKADGGEIDWDPIIDNRNGGTARLTFMQGCAVAVGGVVALLLSAVGLRRLTAEKGEKDGGG